MRKPAKKSKSNTNQTKKPFGAEDLGNVMGVPTVEARLKSARNAILLINQAFDLDNSESVELETVVVEAIVETAAKASDDLYFLLDTLPKDVLGRLAPTPDQTDAMERNGGAR